MASKIKRSAVLMLEYGACRAWHSEIDDIFVDRNTENTSWCIVKLKPSRIEFHTSDIAKLRTVSKQEFGVDVDAEVWVP